jgi:hypothetical protein
MTKDSDRDKVANALRAQQSLNADADLRAAEPLGTGYSSGERLGALGEIDPSDAEDALDDDDVEK